MNSDDGLADRITICDWFLRGFVAAWSAGRRFDTSITINKIRAAFPVRPEYTLAQDLLQLFHRAQVASYRRFDRQFAELYATEEITDIDLSVGFDSWLITIVS